MAKIKSKGKRLYRLNGSTYALIPQLDNIPFSIGSYDETEVSTHDAATDDRESLPTWKQANSQTMSGKWDPADTQHAWLLSNLGGAEQTFIVRYPTTPPKSIAFTAKITGLEIPDDLNGSLDFSFTLGSIRITNTSATDPAA